MIVAFACAYVSTLGPLKLSAAVALTWKRTASLLAAAAALVLTVVESATMFPVTVLNPVEAVFFVIVAILCFLVGKFRLCAYILD